MFDLMQYALIFYDCQLILARMGMPRGMVHRDQVRCRCCRRITCQRAQDAPLGTSGVSVSLSGMRRGLVRGPSSMAGVRQHATPACRPAWDGWATGGRPAG